MATQGADHDQRVVAATDRSHPRALARRGEPGSGTAEKLAQFETNRPRLFGLAYRMLGEATEAEDVVQDAYLRWAKTKTVRVPEAWLTKTVVPRRSPRSH
jgi:DNA-directed RNA polymerase specialized sigma24 family protein